MPWGLKRYHESQQTHFVTFTCYRRTRHLTAAALCRQVVCSLEQTRQRYRFCVYAFVLMPDHVHLLISEPQVHLLANAIQSFKISSSKATASTRDYEGESSPLWQKRYYDRNIRSDDEFTEKMRYIHRNPVKRGLCARPEDWVWSSFRHYACGMDVGVEIESERTAKVRVTAPH